MQFMNPIYPIQASYGSSGVDPVTQLIIVMGIAVEQEI
jgi:hypothetical protein